MVFRTYIMDMHKICALLFTIGLVACGGDTTQSSSPDENACRVYLDGGLAFCVESDTVELTERDCKDRMYRIFDDLDLLMQLSGNTADRPKEASYTIASSCPGGSKIKCEGQFLGQTVDELIYQSRYTGYCSALE